MYGCYLGPAVPAVCCCLLRWLLHALLAAGDTDGQARVLWHLSALLLPGEGRGEAGHGDAGAVWALRLLPRHPKSRVEDLHGGDGRGMRPPPAGGTHSSHGLLHLRPHLTHNWPSGRWHPVCWWSAHRIWLRTLSIGMGQRGSTTDLQQQFRSVSTRFLPDRLGVLLHRGRGGGCHAAVHLAVLFRGEEAEAVPVLKRASERRGQAETSGGTTKGRGLLTVDSHQYSTSGTKDTKSLWCSAHHGTLLI